jgi:hypothetical protein
VTRHEIHIAILALNGINIMTHKHERVIIPDTPRERNKKFPKGVALSHRPREFRDGGGEWD